MTSPTSIFQNPTTFFKALKFNLFSIFVLCFCVSICLLGCVSRVSVNTTDLRQSTYAPVRSDRVYDKNYTIGEKNVAYVGESFVRVKEFEVSKYRSADMIASTDFSITCPTFTILGNQNSGYPIEGQTSIENQTYTVIRIPVSRPSFAPPKGILIKPDGSVHHKVLNREIIMVWDMTITPSNLKFVRSEKLEERTRASGLNYELIYGGVGEKSFKITYREYTDENLARPAFYQNLTYQKDRNQFRFKNTVIKVFEVDNDKLVFAVIEDGLQGK